MPLINHAGGGSSFAAIIQVISNKGATCTCSNGGTTLTAVATSGNCSFKVTRKGTWTVTATLGENAKSENVDISTDGEFKKVAVYAVQIFGISRDITKPSPVWARTDIAESFTATASIGVVAGASDFDDYYPWSGIARETLSTGDVMVKIPKFWYKRYREGDIEYIKIAESELEGFTLHPAFNHANSPKDCVYVGAYKTSSNKLSKSNAEPTTQRSRASFRSSAKTKGTGWQILDISTLSAIQMLILVEFANNDVQTSIGAGYSNSPNISSFYDAQRTGSCDNVPNLTGRPAGVADQVDVVWRGLEGLWGNTFESVDGVNVHDNAYYVCNDPSKYADDTSTDYSLLSYEHAGNWQGEFIEQVGLDIGDNVHVMLPQTQGGSSSSFMCDCCYSASGWVTVSVSGGWTSKTACGLFTADLTIPSSRYSARFGSRLVYIPQ